MEAAGAIGARIAAFLILAGPVGALSCSHWSSVFAFGEGRCCGGKKKLDSLSMWMQRINLHCMAFFELI